MSNPNDNTALVYDYVSVPFKGREVTDAEIALISSIVPPKAKILDIGAGTGRHLIPLSELGYNLTGIDSSNGMLDILEQKLKNNRNSQVIRGDVLTYDFKSEQFDLIIMMWNAFNEIILSPESAQRLLSVFNRILKIGGKVLINSDDPDTNIMSEKNFQLDYSKEGKDFKLNWSVINFDKENNITTALEEIDENGKTSKAEIKQRWWTEKQYRDLAESNGFKFERINLKVNTELYIVFTKLQ